MKRLVVICAAAALLAGAFSIYAALRRRRVAPSRVAPLSPEEERRLAEVIDRPL